ncbi:galactose-1-phosphate uridyl transferase [Tieghemiomyces parasiticus]|uniref:Galactose-1-phosphate uridylyltransferase n=1 Tax=Tieghemiomyces parasiticus TaxID=78921 RepID=A0A9W8A0Z1_9FUNG|nr:galactose-1-phosphate uridyl transferase [Tieghemiomyces parasiticus]
MDVQAVLAVVRTWRSIYQNLRDDPAMQTIVYAQFFENKGAAMGCSNPHPHGQVWALSTVPQEPARELDQFRQYHVSRSPQAEGGDSVGVGNCLLCDYVQQELALATNNPAGSRMVCANEAFVALVPYWALWPYEILVVSRAHLASLEDLTDINTDDRGNPAVERHGAPLGERGSAEALADILRRVTCRYDNLFCCSFPYSMGIHQAPFERLHGEEATSHSDPLPLRDGQVTHFHIHFYPPLLRSATVKKFLVGFEMLGQPQRDITPEQAAARLRDCSEIHYQHQEAC